MIRMDSIDKIVQSYFASVTSVPFEYKGVTYQPKVLQVSPLIFRGFVCPSGCGACCLSYTLDYLPHLTPKALRHELGLKKRWIHFNGGITAVFSDTQEDVTTHHCRNLKPDGRCGIHTKHAFSCDFELLRFSVSGQHEGRNNLNHRLYGRGWNMLRVDGERGAQCYMTDADKKEVPDIVRKLNRLKDWTDHFGIDKTVLPEVIDWVSTGPHGEPLVVNKEFADVRPKRIRLPIL